MCFIFAIGASCNPLTVSVVVRNKKLHNLHNSLTINIMLVDCLATFTIMPIQIYVLLMGRWPFSVHVCQFTGFLTILFSASGLWTILWLSIFRSLHIYRPDKYSIMVKRRSMLAVIASIWGLTFTGCCILVGLNKIKYKAKFNVCFFMFDSVPEMTGFMIPFVVIPIFVINILSVAIFKGMKQRRNLTRMQPQQREEEKGQAYTYLMLVLVYYICYLPVFVIETETVFIKDHELPHSIYMLVTFFGYLPFSVKAIAYMLAKRSTRQAVFRTLKRKSAVGSADNSQRIPMGSNSTQNSSRVVHYDRVEMFAASKQAAVI